MKDYKLRELYASHTLSNMFVFICLFITKPTTKEKK